MTTFFMTPALRGADTERLAFVPMHMRNVFDYVARHTDVALFQVARDRSGVLKAGPNVDFLAPALANARVRIAELNESLVAPLGSPEIEPASCDVLVRAGHAIFDPGVPAIDETARVIGGHVAELIRDGDCLQTGIGAIPAAILSALTDKRDLGLHGGLIDDGGLALIEAGVINGARKAIDRGVHIAGMALGSAALHRALAERSDVQLRGADYTHEVSVIRRLSHFVSINSAVQVDLHGQVNAEFAGGRQISGTGGSVDFMRGARASSGGRSIVAMQATARGGTVSRIVPQVELVTAARTDVDYVVTEFGVAALHDLSVSRRRAALIEIAAPEFRNLLKNG